MRIGSEANDGGPFAIHFKGRDPYMQTGRPDAGDRGRRGQSE